MYDVVDTLSYSFFMVNRTLSSVEAPAYSQHQVVRVFKTEQLVSSMQEQMFGEICLEYENLIKYSVVAFIDDFSSNSPVDRKDRHHKFSSKREPYRELFFNLRVIEP